MLRTQLEEGTIFAQILSFYRNEVCTWYQPLASTDQFFVVYEGT